MNINLINIMTEFQVKDYINLEERSDIDDILNEDEENYLWTGRVTKINKK